MEDFKPQFDQEPQQEQQQQQQPGCQLTIEISNDFWKNFTGYINVQTQKIEENNHIPQSIKADMIANLKKEKVKTKQLLYKQNREIKKQREFKEIIEDKSIDFTGKMMEMGKQEQKEQELAFMLSCSEGTVDILPNEEYLAEKRREEEEKKRRRLQDKQRQWYKGSVFYSQVNSKVLFNLNESFLNNCTLALNRQSPQFTWSYLHHQQALSKHYQSLSNYQELE